MSIKETMDEVAKEASKANTAFVIFALGGFSSALIAWGTITTKLDALLELKARVYSVEHDAAVLDRRVSVLEVRVGVKGGQDLSGQASANGVYKYKEPK